MNCPKIGFKCHGNYTCPKIVIKSMKLENTENLEYDQNSLINIKNDWNIIQNFKNDRNILETLK